MNKLERLLDLVAALLAAERPIPRHELRERMPPGAYSDNDEAFRRTFERDKDELRALGLPLVVETVPGVDPPVDGYQIHRKDYEVLIPGLDPEELAALHLASNLVRLDGLLGDDPSSDLGRAGEQDGMVLARVPAGKAIHELLSAVATRHAVSFDYGAMKRSVQPHRLVFTRGHWYLLGYDKTRRASRQFRVDRFASDVLIEDEKFTPPDSLVEVEENPPWCYGDGDSIQARLLVDAQHAPWVIDYLGATSVRERRSDGSVVVEEEVRSVEMFRSFVLTFLEGAEILAPAELRRDIQAWLEKLI